MADPGGRDPRVLRSRRWPWRDGRPSGTAPWTPDSRDTWRVAPGSVADVSRKSEIDRGRPGGQRATRPPARRGSGGPPLRPHRSPTTEGLRSIREPRPPRPLDVWGDGPRRSTGRAPHRRGVQDRPSPGPGSGRGLEPGSKNRPPVVPRAGPNAEVRIRGKGKRHRDLLTGTGIRAGRGRRHPPPPRSVVRPARLSQELRRERILRVPECVRGPGPRSLGRRGTLRLLPLRFEERPFRYGRRDAMPYPLHREVNLNLRPGPGVRGLDGGERDILLQQGGPAAARRPSDLAIPREERDLLTPRIGRRPRRQPQVPIRALEGPPIDHEAHGAAGGTATPFVGKGLPSDERSLLQVHGPVQAELVGRIPLGIDRRLPRRHVFHLGQDETRLDPGDVQSQHPGRGDVVTAALVHDRIPQGFGSIPLDPNLVPEVSRVPGARDLDRDPRERRGHAPEIPEFLDRSIGSLPEDGPGGRPLHGEGPEVLGHVLDLDVEPDARVLQPFQVRLRRRQPERTVSEVPERPVVDRLASTVAPRRVVDVPLSELLRVAGHDRIDKREGVLPADAVLVERRDVDQSRRMADRMVLHLGDERVRGSREVPGPSAPRPAFTQGGRPRVEWRSSAHDASSRSGPRGRNLTPLPLTHEAPRVFGRR